MTDLPPNTVPPGADPSAAPPQPPVAARVAHAVDSPWGRREDEYYWMRDDARQSPRVLAHLAAENAYTDAVLAPLAAQERRLFEELSARLEPDEASVPVFDRGYWYYARYEAGREYPVHARRAGTMDAPEEIVLDENALAQGHEFFDLGDFEVSPDGRLVAYTQDLVGRRQYELAVREIAGGRPLADRVQNIEADLVWAADSRRVLYVEKDPQTLLSVRVRVHALGTAAQDDRLLYEEQDDSYYLSLGASRSERFLFLCCASTDQTEWWAAEADDPQLAFRVVVPRSDDHEYEVEHLGGEFYLRTNWQAPNFRLVRVPIAASAERSAWIDVVAHDPAAYIEDFELGTSYLAVNERHGGLLRLRIEDRAGGAIPAERLLPEAGAVGTLSLVATPGIDARRVRYEFTSLSQPRSVWEFDLDAGAPQWKKTQAVLGGFDAARYASELRWAVARDGTRVPVSVAWRRDTPLDGSAPVYQYGYGSYGYAIDPEFRSSWVSLMDRGFVVAIAHVRGGQELGRAWFEDGRLLHKRHSFEDFVDVTRMLVATRVGAPGRVCAMGGSAGGLLMGVVANEAPDDYCAIVAHVPFVDVVTTMLDESIPLTTNEFDQWGDPRERAAYDYLLSYSPYDNVRAQAYPALLVFTGLWDSQVQYFEPAKWVARLRARGTGTQPLLFQVDLQAGHGGKSGRYQRLHETAREYAFLLWRLGRLDGLAPAPST
jgi:oligopeptidase B